MLSCPDTLLLTMINRSTRWSEAILLRETTVKATVDTFVATCVALTTDRGVCPVGCTAHHQHSLPQSGQWYGGEAAQSDEGRPTYQVRGSCLGGPPALGDAGDLGRPKGGVGEAC